MLPYEMLAKVRKENNYPGTVDTKYYTDLIYQYSTESDKCIFIEEDVGFIAGIKMMNLMAMPNIPIALQVFWYVLPEYRNTGIGLLLYGQFEAWAIENKCDYIMQEFPTKGCFKVAKNYMRKIS